MTTAPDEASADLAAIARAARALFAAFGSAEVASGSLDRLPDLFAPGARVVILAQGALRAETVAEFIRPRRALLTDGTLTDFEEHETEASTLLGRDIACRKCRYTKSGVKDGVR